MPSFGSSLQFFGILPHNLAVYCSTTVSLTGKGTNTPQAARYVTRMSAIYLSHLWNWNHAMNNFMFSRGFWSLKENNTYYRRYFSDITCIANFNIKILFCLDTGTITQLPGLTLKGDIFLIRMKCGEYLDNITITGWPQNSHDKIQGLFKDISRIFPWLARMSKY